MPGSTASIKVAEKLGFRFERTVLDPPEEPVHCYAIERDRRPAGG